MTFIPENQPRECFVCGHETSPAEVIVMVTRPTPFTLCAEHTGNYLDVIRQLRKDPNQNSTDTQES